MIKQNTATDGYFIPDLEIRITPAWIRFIRFCQVSFPHGDVTIRVVNAQPTDLLEKKPKIRFDKETTIPIEEI